MAQLPYAPRLESSDLRRRLRSMPARLEPSPPVSSRTRNAGSRARQSWPSTSPSISRGSDGTPPEHDELGRSDDGIDNAGEDESNSQDAGSASEGGVAWSGGDGGVAWNDGDSGGSLSVDEGAGNEDSSPPTTPPTTPPRTPPRTPLRTLPRRGRRLHNSPHFTFGKLLRFLLLMLALLICCQRLSSIDPPCHVSSSPNHFVPCTVAIDLNRALSGIPRYVDPDSPDILFEDTTEGNSHAHLYELHGDLHDSKLSYLLGSFRHRLGTSKRRYTLVSSEDSQYLFSRLEGHITNIVNDLKLVFPDEPATSIFNRVVDYFFPVAELTPEVLLAARDDYFHSAKMFFSRYSSLVEAHLRALHLRDLRITEQHEIYALVQNVADSTCLDLPIKALDMKSQILSLQRRRLTRLLFHEAALTCWLEATQQILEERQQHLRETQRLSEIFGSLLQGIRSVDDVRQVTRIGRRLIGSAEKMLAVAPSKGESGAEAERKCIQDWAEEKFGYCVLVEVEEQQQQGIPPKWTNVDPYGYGCANHPDTVWWEFHNAIPINLTLAAEESKTRPRRYKLQHPSTEANHGSNPRFWTNFIPTHRDVQSARTVVHGGRGALMRFKVDVPYWLGVLRLRGGGRG